MTLSDDQTALQQATRTTAALRKSLKQAGYKAVDQLVAWSSSTHPSVALAAAETLSALTDLLKSDQGRRKIAQVRASIAELETERQSVADPTPAAKPTQSPRCPYGT